MMRCGYHDEVWVSGCVHDEVWVSGCVHVNEVWVS